MGITTRMPPRFRKVSEGNLSYADQSPVHFPMAHDTVHPMNPVVTPVSNIASFEHGYLYAGKSSASYSGMLEVVQNVPLAHIAGGTANGFVFPQPMELTYIHGKDEAGNGTTIRIWQQYTSSFDVDGVGGGLGGRTLSHYVGTNSILAFEALSSVDHFLLTVGFKWIRDA